MDLSLSEGYSDTMAADVVVYNGLSCTPIERGHQSVSNLIETAPQRWPYERQ